MWAYAKGYAKGFSHVLRDMLKDMGIYAKGLGRMLR